MIKMTVYTVFCIGTGTETRIRTILKLKHEHYLVLLHCPFSTALYIITINTITKFVVSCVLIEIKMIENVVKYLNWRQIYK